MTVFLLILAGGSIAALGALALHAAQRTSVAEARFPPLGAMQTVDGVKATTLRCQRGTRMRL